MEKQYGARGLVIVGVHSPEFERERSRRNVEAAVEKYGLGAHSHFLDNEMRYWRALHNEYWPAIYVVDTRGQIRERSFGEIHLGTNQDRDLRQLIESLLAEKVPSATP